MSLLASGDTDDPVDAQSRADCVLRPERPETRSQNGRSKQLAGKLPEKGQSPATTVSEFGNSKQRRPWNRTRSIRSPQRRMGFWAALSPARCLVLRPKESCGPARVPHTNAATSAHSSLEKEDLFVPTAFAEPNQPWPTASKAASLEPGSRRDCAEFRPVEPANFGNQRRSEGHSSQGHVEAECLPEQAQEDPRLPRLEERQSTSRGEYAGLSSCIGEPGLEEWQ